MWIVSWDSWTVYKQYKNIVWIVYKQCFFLHNKFMWGYCSCAEKKKFENINAKLSVIQMGTMWFWKIIYYVVVVAVPHWSNPPDLKKRIIYKTFKILWVVYLKEKKKSDRPKKIKNWRPKEKPLDEYLVGFFLRPSSSSLAQFLCFVFFNCFFSGLFYS